MDITTRSGDGSSARPKEIGKRGQTVPTSVRRRVAAITAGVLAASAAVLFCFDPIQHGFYPQCFFHRSTGLLCPGCGSLRALHQLLHGHIVTAFRDNALLITALPFLGWYWVRQFLPRTSPPVIAAERPGWRLWAGLAMMVVFGVVRNLPFAGVAWLRP